MADATAQLPVKTDKALEQHPHWNPSNYVSRHVGDYELYNRMVKVANVHPSESVLDAGCGPGILGYKVMMEALEGTWQVCFVDEDQGMVDEATR